MKMFTSLANRRNALRAVAVPEVSADVGKDAGDYLGGSRAAKPKKKRKAKSKKSA
jgi:hypothetical protein